MCETALGAAILIHHSFEGSDKLSYGCLFQGKVSIRAPARGATAIIGWQVLSGISQRRALACQQGTGG